MIPFIKKTIARLWAQQHVKKSQAFKNSAVKDQERILLDLVKTAKKTLFGLHHKFDTIQSIKQYQEQTPVRDYESLKHYFDKTKRGEANILWPGTPLYFAKTSGTTSGSKYIPISKQGMPFQLQAAQSAILHYIDKKDSADFVNGKMIFLQGSPELEEQNGIKVGRLSGIVAHHIPSYLQKNRLPSLETNLIEDWEQKVDQIVLETEKQNMTLISGIPPWLVMYFEKLTQRSGKKITEMFPNLQLLITGGVNYEPYREKMNELLGKPVDTIQTFPASEGFFAFQDDYKKEGLLLLTNQGIFYEFIPLDQFGKPGATRLTLRDIELNTDYALILTTNSGLWRYAIGDVVRFISKKPYRILVSGRTKHFTSAFGEHVIAIEVEKAMETALDSVYAQVTEFHLAPQVDPKEGLPYHEWFIEFEKQPEDLNLFAHHLDTALQNQNSYYKDLVQGRVLRELKICPLEKGAFLQYAKANGKLGGQNKIPRLANDRKIGDELSKFALKTVNGSQV